MSLASATEERAGDARDPLVSAGAAAGTPARSRKVRKILRLEARAQKLLVRYERALGEATRAMGQARALLDDAELLEGSLTDAQRPALHHGRAEAAGVGTAPGTTTMGQPLTPTRA